MLSWKFGVFGHHVQIFGHHVQIFWHRGLIMRSGKGNLWYFLARRFLGFKPNFGLKSKDWGLTVSFP
jgi:hypothetical protein